MAKRTKVKIDYVKMRKRIIEGSKKTLPTFLKKLIVDDHIAKGKNPVSGGGKYEGYSDSYEKQIRRGRYAKFNKKIRPVNLKLSGEMLKTFFVDYEGTKIRIGFTHKLSKVHNDTANTLRRMLPTNSGERFRKTIMRDIKRFMLDIAVKAMKKK